MVLSLLLKRKMTKKKEKKNIQRLLTCAKEHVRLGYNRDMEYFTLQSRHHFLVLGREWEDIVRQVYKSYEKKI